MKRTAHPKRASLKPRKPIPKVNPARKAKAFAHAYHSRERVAFVKSLPCWTCGNRPSENAHITTGGMGRKAHYTDIVPLCANCHRFVHQKGWNLLLALPRHEAGALACRYAALVEIAWQASLTRTPQ